MKKYLISFCLFFIFVGLVSSATLFTNSVNNVQYTNPSLNSIYGSSSSQFWSGIGTTAFDQSNCEASTDFILMIPPAGCEPMVVRSDLLAEQNVPVMCQLSSLRVNPLIKASAIKSIGFSGDMPEGVAGVSFYPSRAGLRSYNTLLGDPLYNNVGYVVIILKKNSDESNMSKYTSGNLSARISYDADRAYGVGDAVIYLEEGEDSETNVGTFWNGLGSLKLLDVDSKSVKVGVYTREGNFVREIVIKEGETSSLVYFPGFYCRANFKLKLSELTYPDDSALLNINGEKLWVRKGSKILNGRCTVSEVNIFGGQTGKVTLSCSSVGKIELSLLGAFPARLSISERPSETYEVGEFLFDGSTVKEKANLKWYLGYSGDTKGLSSERFIVLLGSTKTISSKTYISLASTISGLVEKYKSNLNALGEINRELSISGFKAGENLIILTTTDSSNSKDFFNGGSSISVEFETSSDSSTPSDKDIVENIAQDLKDADSAVNKLINDYKDIRGDFNKLGEAALLEQIDLLEAVGEKEDSIVAMNKFLETYPSSTYFSLVSERLAGMMNYDVSKARTTFEINNNYYSILLSEFKPVEEGAKTFDLLVDGSRKSLLKEGEEVEVGRTIKFKVIKIYPNRVDLERYEKNDKNVFVKKESKTIRVDEPYEWKIDDKKSLLIETANINVKSVARIELLSEASRTSTTANFSYTIGIEQRTIQLNPNKSSEKAAKLNETIRKLEEKTESLGELIRAWKGVCYVTNLGLTVKNLLQGYSGESLARQEVMAVWRDYCRGIKETGSLGTVKSVDSCYSDNSLQISNDISEYTKAIEEINSMIGTETNVSKFVEKEFKGLIIEGIAVSETASVSIPADSLITWDEIRAYLLHDKLKDAQISLNLKKSLKSDRDAKLMSAVERSEKTKEKVASTGMVPIRSEKTVEKVMSGYKASQFNELSSLNLGDSFVETYLDGGNEYILVLEDERGGKRDVGNIYKKTSIGFTQIDNLDKNFNTIKNLVFLSSGNCKNPNLDPVVHYYDSGTSKGLPAVVPFDVREGWYVKVSSSSGGILSTESKGYSSSAVPETFTICNVGSSDKRQTIDDACTTVSINIDLKRITSIAGCILDSSKVTRLVNDAQEAIRQAGRQYSETGKTVRISISGRESFDARRGTPAGESGPTEQCQDFMSVEDCQLLFNVCDPVMCPVSRCDFGGKYPVSNVIQSGIIGSLVLCLPNFKGFGGDVYVPICLTGVHAGLEAYISVLKAQRDCLVEHAESGTYSGMCDYTTAVYKCNLVWNQLQPFMSNLLPSLFSAVTGRQKAGGGEYRTFQKAWDGMESSLDYFMNIYGKTSFTQLKLGNTEQAGGEFCNAFVGTSFPTSSDAIDAMLAPESPYQFYAEFSEIAHTDATVPPTSQYKVFAHIYAGNDSGISYSVYLKNPPTSSYYAGIPYINVETGYVSRGQQKQLSKDFTAPAGYKELCVSVNGKEECGFKQVTTNFAIDYLADSYISRQANQTSITTESECQQGTSGVIGFTSINPQAAVENVVNPNIALEGIVRVCSSANPGKGTDDSNWVDVGFCGNNAIRCWLDQSSVSSATSTILDVSANINQAESALEFLNSGATMNESTSQEKISEIKIMIGKLTKPTIDPETPKILGNITLLEDKGFSNVYQAQGVYLRFKLYEKIVYLKKNQEVTTLAVSELGVISETDSTGVSPVDTTPSTLGEMKEGYKLGRGGRVYTITSVRDISDSEIVISLKDSAGQSSSISGTRTSSLSSKGYTFDGSNVV